MLDDFMTRATLAGIGVAIASAPLGSFVVWRRMAYFGDATAHAAILGIALSLALQISIFAGAVAVALAMALAVTFLSGRGYAMDTLLGVLAHSALAFGLVAVSFLQGVRIDLMAYLFGDILAVSRVDLAVIGGGALVVVGLIAWRWSALLTATLSDELAHASGIDPKREQLILTVALAITVAVAIKVVGVILIAAMLIIPAAAARPLARTPEQMAIAAAVIGGMAAVLGLRSAYIFDTPAGPSIVCVAAIAFVCTSAWQWMRSALGHAE
ncbi:High-affinity zinc uptake system membrane protein ZnuB [Rhodobacteraceae bacterium THAF1]|uniref:iron chelate uptake ABC transporter family permease subunit n=1 Tax=Palleronia sp. THAF1 TaxID=2587842 RepID=UPI000F3B6DE1|nr:iron chelate uptake ABC transporter family permease subunit [Palleronia sp. THAF1]QFU08147.1 High-affinity zinc uptake system membrane protein ZnuB [Palleronia sp. THAF1]VDC28698.1 High-affinity zinc uptake system membrane protein ZnuB [Rhodobacteraceae bacterium THAF1]